MMAKLSYFSGRRSNAQRKETCYGFGQCPRNATSSNQEIFAPHHRAHLLDNEAEAESVDVNSDLAGCLPEGGGESERHCTLVPLIHEIDRQPILAIPIPPSGE